jgi:two-component system KDP operon response regulator KdpE
MSQKPFILIVEDDERLRDIETRYLEAAGYTVLGAATFAQALDLIAIKPSVMILDINLPDLSGWDVANWLESQISGVPVIVTSGLVPDPKKLRQFKPVAVLAKPFSMPELLGLVVQYASAS